MAVFIEANYSKKIGLPAYSSHSFSVTVRSEVSDFNEVERESAKLYGILQNAVDSQIVEPGYTPVPFCTASSPEPRSNSHTTPSNGDQWACSDKQKALILRVVEEHKLDKQEVEALAKEMFNTPVKALNKMQASGLIEELLNKYGDSKPSGGNGRRQYQRGGARQ